MKYQGSRQLDELKDQKGLGTFFCSGMLRRAGRRQAR